MEHHGRILSVKKIMQWFASQAKKPRATYVLSGISFTESFIFPIPPDALLIPLVLYRPKQAWFFATLCTLLSVAGGLVGYAIGYWGYEIFGQTIIEYYGYQDTFEILSGYYTRYGAWFIFFGGLTPFPYKLITIFSGISGLNLVTFILSGFIARGVRFFAVAAILKIFGKDILAVCKTKLFQLIVVAGIFLLVVYLLYVRAGL